MKIHRSAEDYLEAILHLQRKRGTVRAIHIAEELNVSKPSVSIAMKKLRENGYIRVEEGGAIGLLPPGEEVAQRIYGRHRLLTELFVGLGVRRETAEADACKVEHDLSEETVDAIRDYLDGK